MSVAGAANWSDEPAVGGLMAAVCISAAALCLFIVLAIQHAEQLWPMLTALDTSQPKPEELTATSVAPVTTLVLTRESEALAAAAKQELAADSVDITVVSKDPPNLSRSRTAADTSVTETAVQATLNSTSDIASSVSATPPPQVEELVILPPVEQIDATEALASSTENPASVQPIEPVAVAAPAPESVVQPEESAFEVPVPVAPISIELPSATSVRETISATSESVLDEIPGNIVSVEPISALEALLAESREVLSSVESRSGKIQFIEGTSIVVSESEDLLQQIFEDLFLYAESDITITVNGNDEDGGALARDRGEQVKEFLIGRGLEEERLIVRVLPDAESSRATQYLSIQANTDE